MRRRIRQYAYGGIAAVAAPFRRTADTAGGDLAVDEAKLDEFMAAFVSRPRVVMRAATVVLSDELGLYKALAGRRLPGDELAQATGTDWRDGVTRVVGCELREYEAERAGVGHGRRAAEAPFNLVYEARP